MNHVGMRLATMGPATALALTGVVGGSGAAGADKTPATVAWGTCTSAAAGVQGSLDGVAAGAADDVVAAGAYTVAPPDARYLQSAYAEHWNGAKWTATTVPVPAYFRPQLSVLNAAAAAGRSNSWAVGTVSNAGVPASRRWRITGTGRPGPG